MNVRINQKYKYDGSLCNSPNCSNTGGIVTVRKIRNGAIGKVVELREKMAYKGYGIFYFGSKQSNKPFRRIS